MHKLFESFAFRICALMMTIFMLAYGSWAAEDSDIAQAVADDVSEAQHEANLMMAEREACKALRGPDAQVYLLDGQHLVCRDAVKTGATK